MSMPAEQEQVTPIYDLDMARDFFRMIERDGSFMLQTFDDVPRGVKGDPALGSSVLWPAGDPAGQERTWKRVLQLYARGAGVFFTVNRTDGAGRRRENIPSIRGVWRENDNGDTTALPLQPSLIVESSPGKFHEYILASDHWPADEQGSAEHRAIEERMIESYGSDPNAKDLSRVLRVPGFLHRKDKNRPHLVRVVSSPGWRYPRQQIVDAFPPVESARQQAKKTEGDRQPPLYGEAFEKDDGEGRRIRDALFSIDATERHVWLTIGMAIEAHYGDAGRSLWDEWSATAPDKYGPDDQDRVWKSFGGSGIGIGSLFHYAKHGGWEDSTERFYEEWRRKHAWASGAKSEAEPLDISGLFNFAGDVPAAPPKELIKKLLPAEGVAVTGGQSTAGKTFIQIHKSICVAAGIPYFGHSIVERVGTCFVAAEGRPLINNRIMAAMIKEDGVAGRLPICWPKLMPDFSSADGIKLFVRYMQELDRRFRGEFGMRLGHIVIDTVAAVCNLRDEDDNAEATKICNILRSIFEETGALMAPVHHYGKNATSGLRGASAWKASADVVEGVLADIDALSGETSNREVVSNKARDGVQGPLSPFNLEYVSLGLDQYGEDYGSCRVVPIDGSSRFVRTATSGKGDRAFRDAFGEVLDGRSETITPRAGMAPVRAVRVTDVRGEFDRRYVTGRADKKEAADTKRKAFDRALNKLSPGEFGAAEIGGVEWVWRVQS